MSTLRQDAALTVTAEPRIKYAKVYFESIEEVPTETDRVPNTGFTFFAMETS